MEHSGNVQLPLEDTLQPGDAIIAINNRPVTLEMVSTAALQLYLHPLLLPTSSFNLVAATSQYHPVHIELSERSYPYPSSPLHQVTTVS